MTDNTTTFKLNPEMLALILNQLHEQLKKFTLELKQEIKLSEAYLRLDLNKLNKRLDQIEKNLSVPKRKQGS